MLLALLFLGEGFSISPNACSLEEDLQGMNLSLQIDFEVGDDDAAERLVIDLGDDTDRGEERLRFDRRGVELFDDER